MIVSTPHTNCCMLLRNSKNVSAEVPEQGAMTSPRFSISHSFQGLLAVRRKLSICNFIRPSNKPQEYNVSSPSRRHWLSLTARCSGDEVQICPLTPKATPEPTVFSDLWLQSTKTLCSLFGICGCLFVLIKIGILGLQSASLISFQCIEV